MGYCCNLLVRSYLDCEWLNCCRYNAGAVGQGAGVTGGWQWSRMLVVLNHMVTESGPNLPAPPFFSPSLGIWGICHPFLNDGTHRYIARGFFA